MDITIKINCDNAAFEDSLSAEVSRILCELASDVAMVDLNEPFDRWRPIRDCNGNKVGDFTARGKNNHEMRIL